MQPQNTFQHQTSAPQRGPPSLQGTSQHANEDELNSSDEEEAKSSFLSLPSSAPQLETSALAFSPLFGQSFANLLAPTSPEIAPPMPSFPSHLYGAPPSSNPSITGSLYTPSAGDKGTTLGGGRRPSTKENAPSGFVSHGPPQREPTLVFAKPRQTADVRVRREGGKEEDVWIGQFPDEEAETGEDEPERWSDREWKSVKKFLRDRGYEVDLTQGTTEPILAERKSDQLPLRCHFVPADDSGSDELDVVERLSSLSLRTQAKVHGCLALLPVVGIVPLSANWSAVLSERWPVLNDRSAVAAEAFGKLAVDVTGAIAFLHSHHIAHLALAPQSIASSPLSASTSTAPQRWTLTDLGSSVQSDPLSKKTPLVSGAAAYEEYGAPEMSDAGRYNPFTADVFGLGKVLELLAKNSAVKNAQLDELLRKLTLPNPAERTTTVAEALKQLRAIYP